MPNIKNTNRKPKTKNVPKKEMPPAVRKETNYLIMAGVGLLLLLAVFLSGSLGPFGVFFRGFLIGMFGLGGVFVPIALIFYAVLGFRNQAFRIPVISSAFLAWFVLGLLHLIARLENVYDSAFQYLGAVYRAENILSGGIVGAILGSILHTILGIGAWVVITIVIMVLVVYITKISFIKLVEDSVGKARHLYKETKMRQATEDDLAELEDFEYTPKTQLKLDKPRLLKKGKQRPQGKSAPLKPLVRKEPKGAKSQIIEMHPEESATDHDPYTLLLVQEELTQQAQDALDGPREVPEFLRAAIPFKREEGPKINVPEPEPMPEPIYEPEALPPEVIEEPVHEEEPIYIEEALPEIDFVYASADSVPPEVEEYTPATFVVKGLVEDTPVAPPAPVEIRHEEAPPIEKPAERPVAKPAEKPSPADYSNFVIPAIDLLSKSERPNFSAESRAQVMQNSRILEETLRSFRVEAEVIEVSVGPTVTRYDLAPGPGVKVSSIANLSNDLALSLAAQGIRIEAPIPGKSAVGIEIPNKEPQGVFLRDILENEKFENFPSKLAFAVGKDIAGSPVVADVADMPHLLIAGATGAGKSVCINTLIASLLYKAKPNEVKLLMIDPKVVELSVYNGIPHLLIPVVTDPKKASGALNWAVQEMESRYNAFAETGCRDLKGYNRYLNENTPEAETLPQIVIIIDELADLMMTCKGEVEEAICRLAQKARAAGIHLIVATQRPSVDVITGLIKANIPSRLAFAVSSGTDSRTVLDMQGAEKLLGRGDMLFLPRGQNKPIRVQGGFISDKEVENLVAFLKAQAPTTHTTEMIQQITMPGKGNIEGEVDEFFHDAVEFLIVKGKGSTSMLQRQFRIGYNRASRLMDDLERRGVVGPEDGVKPRKITMTREEYQEIYGDQE